MREFLQYAGLVSGRSEASTPEFLERYWAAIHNDHTWRALESDWRDFMGQEMSDSVLRLLFSLPNAQILLLLREYENLLRQRALKSTTRNRRLTSLRKLFRVAEREGWRQEQVSHLIKPEVATTKPKSQIESEVIDKLLKTPQEGTLSGARDAVMLRLMIENGLSRAQLCALDVGDFLPYIACRSRATQVSDAQLQIVRLRRRKAASAKGIAVPAPEGVDEAREKVPLSSRCARKIRKYLQMLEKQDAEVKAASPLLRALDRRQFNNPLKNQRLTPDGVYAIIARYAKMLDAPLSSRALQSVRPLPVPERPADKLRKTE